MDIFYFMIYDERKSDLLLDSIHMGCSDDRFTAKGHACEVGGLERFYDFVFSFEDLDVHIVNGLRHFYLTPATAHATIVAFKKGE